MNKDNKPYCHKILFFTLFLFLTIDGMGQHFSNKKSVDGIEILEKGKRVLFYQVQPKTVDGKYERAGYVHPLFDLNEKILTDDMPADHPFHRGIFWAWHQIILNDTSIGDGWTSENIFYTPVSADVKEYAKCSILESEMIWNAKLKENDSTPIVREKTKITVFRATPQYRILDFDIKLYALKDNLKIGGSDDPKGYGGFCLRLKLPKDITFFSGDKQIEPQETAVPAGPWMDISGSFAGQSIPNPAVAVFGYRKTNNNNNPWILRKVTSMQNVPYPGRTPVPLSKYGKNLKYRIVVHNSDMKKEEIEKLYREWK